jgi:hypothetical protein
MVSDRPYFIRQAEKCRRLAKAASDDRTMTALVELATFYDQQATRDGSEEPPGSVQRESAKEEG